ncbi:MAG: acyl-CoA dehydrogenase family protein [Phycisphaerales bacterium]|nr:acyl-CoA dehydrogenase family protein [Phycisphaerales bacterium]
MSSNDQLVDKLKNISEKDRKQIQDAQEMLGPDPATMGFIKNLFWANYREELVFPFPEEAQAERARCDELLDVLDAYLKNEHPTIEIDQDEHIPDWAIRRLFKIGVLGMIIPQQYGGGGFTVTSYNRVLERIGQTCGSTAVMVSAHQSIGCGAINLFGTEEQKDTWLPRMASSMLSAFCLSEPNVGCDAGGQETWCTESDCGKYYIINGEKKWATSGALSGMFTTMCKHEMVDPKSGKKKTKVTALICTPDMEGIDIFSANRSKCGIRGTWQARVRFTNVKVPRSNLLHEEGRGLNVALTCLNWGRCTLSAGMVGAGRSAYLQALKWSETRYQFNRPLGEFELVRDYLASMASYNYAMDAMLYMTTGIVDRNDDDIMLETAICKVFCSEMGFRCTNMAMQVMGGEGYMTENELERLWRDSRINTIVEGANEVMHAFVFAYGSKQLGEHMLAIRAAPFKKPVIALKLAAELFLGIRPSAPKINALDPSLREHVRTIENMTSEFSYQVKRMFKVHEEELITNQMVQRRLSTMVIWIHAMGCCLSRLDQSIRNGIDDHQLKHDRALVDHICAMGHEAFEGCIRNLDRNTDATMRAAADAAWATLGSLPYSDYSIPEKTPVESARGQGRVADQSFIKQFGGGSIADRIEEGLGAEVAEAMKLEKDLA